MSLVEVMVAVAVITIGAIAAIGSFRYISFSLQESKSRTLATNLAQEQVEKLKNLSYYMLLVTTSTANDSNFASIAYDNASYPSQTLTEGGITFTRGTRVDFAYQTGNTVSTTSWTSDDTGLKQITTYTIWKDATGWQYMELKNLRANPAANPLTATFTGTVRDNLTVAVSGALVQVLDNPSWYGYTNASGVYRFNVSQGSYTLQCSSQGYFNQTTPGLRPATSNSVTTVDFTLGRMSSGTVGGYVYINEHPVISQVVASSINASGFYQEYIELYNPTTSTWLIGSPTLDLLYKRQGSGVQTITLDYSTLSIAPSRYYLVANTTTITVAGVSRTADAVFQAGNANYPNVLQDSSDGSVRLVRVSDGATLDTLGWRSTALAPNYYESVPLSDSTGAGVGLDDNEQYVRLTHPGFITSGYGRAYDSNDNSKDFLPYSPISFAPYNSSTSASPRSGTPATGAYAYINDGLSSVARCTDVTAAGYRACYFSVTNVSTGTWKLVISSGGYYKEVDNIVVTPSVSTSVPHGSTSPNWTSVGNTSITLLDETTTYGFISGTVYNASSLVLSNIKIESAGKSVFTNGSGDYFLSALAGAVQVNANPNDTSMNRAYTTGSTSINLAVGEVRSNTDFYLSLGGTLRAYIRTASLTALPARVVVATLNGYQMAQATSDNSGYAYLANLSTGTYVLQPQVDSAETVSPSSVTVVLNSTGTAVTITTFTVTNGLAEITGRVLSSSSATLKTGVLVLASTTTLTGSSSTPAPSVYGATGASCNPCYYMNSSDASGNFSVYVRSSTTPYRLYGWYTTFSDQTPTTRRVGPYSVTATNGGAIYSQNLQW